MNNAFQLFILLLVGATLPAAIVAMLAIYPIRRHAIRLGLMDRPGGHKAHTQATPLGGGIGIALGVVVTFAIATLAVFWTGWIDALPESLAGRVAIYADGAQTRIGMLWSLIGAGLVLVVLGFVDDRRGLPWQFRLAVQFGVAIFTVYGMGIGLTAFIGLAWLTKLMSVLWIVAVINSFNMLDNMDGLSGGVAAVIATSMAIVMISTPDPATAKPQLLVAAFLMVVLGALLGFLWHNRPPAKIFMGDTGSYLVGYLISVAMLMATFAGGGEGRPHAVLAPLCAMAVPLYDMCTVLWIRIREGRSPFQADRRHFSHRLVELGMTRPRAVVTIYLVTATCGLAAILLTHVTVLQAITVLGIVGCMLWLIGILESTRWNQ
ncbi:MraY family glycosyltransferase [Crateriforma conspicua]|uniref:WecA-like glycosyltransferase n=1 Tax=Crateriforma conspicua TaxID=2527996 RepID=A0A5C5XZ62_9PLAN|nr:MraY family glycosyltransferase [Crateriforma conspicua]TWT68184.1 WecA-like glycosyltransferase [Crateriforma conspicua]